MSADGEYLAWTEQAGAEWGRELMEAGRPVPLGREIGLLQEGEPQKHGFFIFCRRRAC